MAKDIGVPDHYADFLEVPIPIQVYVAADMRKYSPFYRRLREGAEDLYDTWVGDGDDDANIYEPIDLINLPD